MAAYEALWEKNTSSFKKIAEYFAKHPGARPSDLVSEDQIQTFLDILARILEQEFSPSKLNFLINSTYDYPRRLRDAKEPVEVLYYMGNLDYINTRSVAVVGTRKPTKDGLARAAKLVKLLVQDNFTVVSGLAEGIDTQAHTTAIEAGGRTIAIIGTPLNKYYPKQNKEIQDLIARDHLLLSQVPFWRYNQQDYRMNRFFFPERNKTMSALTEATIIIEAGETSGTLVQAKAALYQKRKLFILDSCFQNPKITWPRKFEQEGAIRVRDYEDIKKALKTDVSKTQKD